MTRGAFRAALRRAAAAAAAAAPPRAAPPPPPPRALPDLRRRLFRRRADRAWSPSPARSFASDTPSPAPPAEAEEEEDRAATPAPAARPPGDVYHAHLAETVRNVKLLSLASLGATVCGTPLLLELASPDMLPEAKLTVSLVVDGFGGFTTALLQWFVSPYVLRMRVVRGGPRDDEAGGREPGGGGSGNDPSDPTVEVTKLTLTGREFSQTFPASAMREAETTRPLVTWEAEGKLHYVEMANVPESLYEGLGLERFDAQAQAMKHAEEAKRRGDDDDDDDD